MNTVIKTVFLSAILTGSAGVYADAGSFSDDESERDTAGYEVYDLVLPDIEIRQNVSANLNVHVTANTGKSCREPDKKMAGTFVVIHGITHTAATWGPFTEALVQRAGRSNPVCNVLAIDLPGHGKSGLPSNMFYGDLSFEDYVESVKEALAKLKAIGYRSANLIGFSHAGYMLQLVQQSLLDEGSSLRQAYGIRNTIFFASSLPTPLAWSFADSGAGADFITQFYRFVPMLGTHVDIPNDVWPSLWFVNAAGNLVSGAPTPEQVAAKGYNTVESAAVVSQLLAVPPYVRPSVRAGVYSKHHGTRLTLVTYSNDIYISPEESKTLYLHLAEDNSYADYLLIEDDTAVHDFHMAQPAKLVKILRAKNRL